MVRPTSSCRFPLSSTKALLHLSLLLSLCAAFAAFLPTAASAAGSGPIASYSFDEGTGETVQDLTGNGHTATIHGAEWTTHGKYGGAMEFEGSEQDYLSVPDSPELDFTEELTVEAWVRPNGEENVWAPLFAKQIPGDQGLNEFSYYLYEGDYEENRPHGGVYGGDYLHAGSPLSVGAWSHLALTYDGHTERLYVDGKLVDQGLAEAPPVSEGELDIGGSSEQGNFFSGRIDEARIYNRVLNEAELALDMETPLATPKAGPVAAWSFDEGKGTTAADLTGHGHTATISKATWTHGRFGNGLKFDGKKSCVTVPNSPELNFTEEMTLEAWVRPIGSKKEGDPLFVQVDEAAGAGEEGYVYDFLAGEKEVPKAWVRKSGSGFLGVYGTEPLPEGTWSHVTLTDDGANLRLYVDGELVRTAPAPTLTTGNGPLQIGCDIWNDHFEGRIDEVRLYNRALTTAEVGTDMEAPVQTPKTGPVAAYSFDEGTGETAEDLTGNGHTATLQGAEWTTHGRYGGALEFHAEDEDFVSIPASTSLDGNEELTVEAWVRPQKSSEANILIKEREGSGPRETYSLYQHGDQARGYFEGNEEGMLASPEHSLPTNTWTHLAIADDGAWSRLYVNGQLVDTKLAQPIEGHGEIRLGGNSIWGDYFDGRIDEVRIYGRSLDAAEVAADMETPLQTPKAGPVAAYSFDEDNEATQADATGHGHTATVEGGTKWTSHGRYGGAMEFDGENDCLSITADEELQATEEFTVEAWVRPEGSGERPLPVIAMDDENSGPGEEEFSYLLFAGQNAAPEGWVRKPGESGTWDVWGEEPLPEKTWSHVSLTDDGHLIRLYVNGKFVGDDVAPPLTPAEGPLNIGCGIEYGPWRYFKGRIDEVRVYNRAINDAEMGTDMAAPIQTPQQGPIAAWSFDEVGEGGTVEDLTGDGHTGTVEGATLARGKYGQALQFDGENDVVKVPNSPEFALTEGFTLESWVRPESASNEWAPILAKEMGGGEAATELAWWLYEAGEHANEPYGGTEPKAGENDHAESDDPLPVNAWSHVALTWDGSKVRLYVNGELVDCSPVVPAGAPPVTEGELQIGGATEHGDYFKGRLDEVRIYNRGLTQAEIQQTMNATFPTATTNEATGASANDAILNGIANANGGNTEYYFEYGTSKSYGEVVTGEELGTNRENLEVSEAVTRLAPETTYHYRLVAEGLAGTAYGKDQILTTGARTESAEEEAELAAQNDAFDLTKKAKASVPTNFYGMMWSGELDRMATQNRYKTIEDSGAKIVRLLVQPGQKNQPAINEAFRLAANHHLEVLPILGGNRFPKFGSTRRAEWINYAKKIVGEYGPGGSRKYKYPVTTWEIWNEPNMPYPPKQGETVSPEVEWKVNAKAFALFMKEMSESIRAGAGSEGPNIRILAPGLFGYKSNGCSPNCHKKPVTFLHEMNHRLEELEKPGDESVYEAISLHPYVFTVGTAGNKHAPMRGPEIRTVQRAIEQSIADVAKEMKMPIWVTEIGFPVENNVNTASFPPVGEEVQAKLVRASFAMMQNQRGRYDIQHVFYYNIQDRNEDGWDWHCGLLNYAGNPRLALFQYEYFAN